MDAVPNRYFQEFCRLRGWMMASERQPTLSPLEADADAFRTLCQTRARFAYAIPTEEALRLIATHAPLVEMGAGIGYWAWLLRLRGLDVLAYDIAPPDTSTRNLSFPRRPCWTMVEQGDPSLLSQHADRTLILCWPPRADPMAAEALRAYTGQTVIYIGEEPGATSGDEDFVALLASQWVLVETLNLPNWNMLHDRLCLYRRRAPHLTSPALRAA